jgi:hypothetical protein
MALLLPILTVVLTLGTVMLAIYLGYRKKKEMFTLYHQERMAAIEKGIEVPPIPDAFFMNPANQGTGRDLLKGLVWLFVGVGLTVALYHEGEKKEALFGLIPAGIGLAYLIYYAVEGRRAKQPEPEKRIGPGAASVSTI